MSAISIIVNDDIYLSEISSNIVSTFYVQYQGQCFPNDKWTDFTEPILNMWLYKLLQNKDLKNVKFELFFMDGPFRLDVYKDDNMLLTINCINARGKSERPEFMLKSYYYDFLQTLYDAIKAFSYNLFKNGLNHGRFKSVYRQTIMSMKEIKKVMLDQNSVAKPNKIDYNKGT